MYLLSSGWRGDVFIEEINGVKYAIKKAKQEDKKGAIKKEIAILNFLKGKVNFVPQIVDFGDDFFKYKFIEGQTLNKVKNPSKDIYKKLLNYSYILDSLHIEHGELSKPTKNIIVTPENEVYIIDFERGSFNNTKSKNLRGYAQFLLNLGCLDIITLKEIMQYKEPKKIYEKILDLCF